MMRFARILAAALMVIVAGPALAALPPIYQRTAELAAVIEAVSGSPDLDTIGEVIAIEYVDVDRYEVRGATCTIVARIVSTPAKGPAIVGPREFTVALDPPFCR